MIDGDPSGPRDAEQVDADKQHDDADGECRHRDAGQEPLTDRGRRQQRGQPAGGNPSPPVRHAGQVAQHRRVRAGMLRRRWPRSRRRGSATSAPVPSSPAAPPSSGAGRRSAGGRPRCPGRGSRPVRRSARRAERGSGCCRPSPARWLRTNRASAGAIDPITSPFDSAWPEPRERRFGDGTAVSSMLVLVKKHSRPRLHAGRRRANAAVPEKIGRSGEDLSRRPLR